MKNIRLWIPLIITVGLLLPPHPWAKASEDITATMKSPQGEVQVYTSKEEGQFKGIKRALPVGEQEWRKSLCMNQTPDEALDFTETHIELDTMINELNNSKKPRQLSDYQKDFLSSIPPCTPYILKLRVIVRLLQNYDLIELTYK